MGFERYCTLCSGPLHNSGCYYNIKQYNKILTIAKKVLSKNVFRLFVSDMEYSVLFYYITEEQFKTKIIRYKKLLKVIDISILLDLFNKRICLNNVQKYKWLQDIIWLNKNGTNIKIICGNDTDTYEGIYSDKNGTIYDESDNGSIIHKDCLKLLESKYGKINYTILRDARKLNYSIWLNKQDHTPKSTRKSYKINTIPGKYDQQDIQWLNYFLDNNDFLLESPLINIKNKNRLLQIKYTKYLTKKDSKQKMVDNKKNRPSPSESATKYSIGTTKKGNDKNVWIIMETKNGIKKWKKL